MDVNDLPLPLGAARNQSTAVHPNATNTTKPTHPVCTGNTFVFYYQSPPAGDVGFGFFLNRLSTLWAFLKIVDQIYAASHSPRSNTATRNSTRRLLQVRCSQHPSCPRWHALASVGDRPVARVCAVVRTNR
jgi:hypothetical protein